MSSQKSSKDNQPVEGGLITDTEASTAQTHGCRNLELDSSTTVNTATSIGHVSALLDTGVSRFGIKRLETTKKQNEVFASPPETELVVLPEIEDEETLFWDLQQESRFMPYRAPNRFDKQLKRWCDKFTQSLPYPYSSELLHATIKTFLSKRNKTMIASEAVFRKWAAAAAFTSLVEDKGVACLPYEFSYAAGERTYHFVHTVIPSWCAIMRTNGFSMPTVLDQAKELLKRMELCWPHADTKNFRSLRELRKRKRRCAQSIPCKRPASPAPGDMFAIEDGVNVLEDDLIYATPDIPNGEMFSDSSENSTETAQQWTVDQALEDLFMDPLGGLSEDFLTDPIHAGVDQDIIESGKEVGSLDYLQVFAIWNERLHEFCDRWTDSLEAVRSTSRCKPLGVVLLAGLNHVPAKYRTVKMWANTFGVIPQNVSEVISALWCEMLKQANSGTAGDPLRGGKSYNDPSVLFYTQ